MHQGRVREQRQDPRTCAGPNLMGKEAAYITDVSRQGARMGRPKSMDRYRCIRAGRNNRGDQERSRCAVAMPHAAIHSHIIICTPISSAGRVHMVVGESGLPSQCSWPQDSEYDDIHTTRDGAVSISCIHPGTRIPHTKVETM
jgi:hypothetical protein